MKKQLNLEAASLKVLSGFYRNDMALFARHAYDRFLFSVPGREADVQTPLSIRDVNLFTEASSKYAIRNAAPPVLSQDGPICTILMKYTLDLYRKEIPDSQQRLQLLICWLNTSEKEDEPVWRITLFHIYDQDKGENTARELPIHQSSRTMRRDALVREPLPSYASHRSNLIRIRDNEHAIHFLEKDDIIWAESDHLHSIIHTHAGTIRTNTTLSQLANNALSCLYRPHISYLINPHFLYQLNNTHLILTDGTIIPIPERRLSQVKKDLCRTF